jgi:molybdopterin biosynthesis enzyme
MVADSEIQRIARLTPLADVLASFDLSVGPVEPREEALLAALGKTLAADIRPAAGHPARALALRDGYAVRAEDTLDASAYAPVALTPAPAPIETGAPMPDGTDAVAPPDAVQMRGGSAEIIAPITPGDGVLPAGGDTAAGQQLRLAGARLRRIDLALLTTLGIERVMIREPRVAVVRAAAGSAIDGAAAGIATSVRAEGGVVVPGNANLEAALNDAGNDAVIAIGGTGSGRNDASVRTLARIGQVAFHGIAIAPGETTALGFVGARPVLLLPGRFDGALAGWLTVGRRMLARRCFRLIEDQPFAAELGRKIASPLGLAEVVPVRRRLAKVEPLASGGYLSMQALARAEGWILVPADSEGYPEGGRVMVRPWP